MLIALMPFIKKLIGFIRDAERVFTTPGSGADKLKWVEEQFLPLLDDPALKTFIPSKFLDAVKVGLPAVIGLIVQFYNVTNGTVPTNTNVN